MDRHYFTREEVADLLRVSLNTILRMEARGEIPTVRFGKKCVRIPAYFVLRVTGRATCAVHPAPAHDAKSDGGTSEAAADPTLTSEIPR